MRIVLIAKTKPIRGDLTNLQVLYEIHWPPPPAKTCKDERQEMPAMGACQSLGSTQAANTGLW